MAGQPNLFSLNPSAKGSALAVALVTDLANADIGGMALGTLVWAQDQASYFFLAESTAAVDHTTVEAVAGTTSLRWVKFTVGGGFGANTQITLPNDLLQGVTALQLVNALTNPAHTAEASNWLIKVLLAGVQVTPVSIAGDVVTFQFNQAGAGSPSMVLKNLNASAQSIFQFQDVNGVLLGQLRADFTGALVVSPGAASMILSGLNSGSATQGFTLSATGTTVGGRLRTGRGAAVAVATTITLGFDGNVFPLTVGTGTLNSISAVGWTPGSVFWLEAAGGITITHNVAGTGATILIPKGDSGAGTSIVVSATAGLNPRGIPILYNGTNMIVIG